MGGAAADDDLREVARTPLLMALFAEGYKENAADAAELRDLRASPGALRDAIFERYINQRYAWEDRQAWAATLHIGGNLRRVGACGDGECGRRL